MPQPLNAEDAEGLVAAYLTTQGWSILARNCRYRGAELDIIARLDQLIAVVEVKARRFAPQCARDYEMLLSPAKRRCLQRGVTQFLAREHIAYETVRFDLAVVHPACPFRRGPLLVRYFRNAMG